MVWSWMSLVDILREYKDTIFPFAPDMSRLYFGTIVGSYRPYGLWEYLAQILQTGFLQSFALACS